MFCSKCGKENSENSSFCRYCGTRLNRNAEEMEQTHTENNLTTTKGDLPAVSERQNEYQTSYTNINVDTSASNDTDNNRTYTLIIGSNIGYYSKQFQRLQNGGEDRINWASFFLSLYHAAYRDVWRDWLLALRAPLITGLVLIVCMNFAISLSFDLVMILGVAYLVVMIWMFIAGIKFAKRFNRIYKDHVDGKARRGDLKPDTSVGRALLVLLVVAVIVFALNMIGGFSTFYSLGGFDDGYYDDQYYYDFDDYAY